MPSHLLLVSVQVLQNRVNSAIDTLKQVRAGMIAERKRDATSSIRSDLASAFGRKRGVGSKPAITSKKAKRAAWKHEFVCLAYFQQKKVPTTECERDELFEAEKGDRILYIGNGCKHIQGGVVQSIPKTPGWWRVSAV